jgi:hypothetical protein
MYFKLHKRVRVQNMRFEIVTAVNIKFRDLLDVTLCSTINISNERGTLLVRVAWSEYQGSSFIWMAVW